MCTSRLSYQDFAILFCLRSSDGTSRYAMPKAYAPLSASTISADRLSRVSCKTLAGRNLSGLLDHQLSLAPEELDVPRHTLLPL